MSTSERSYRVLDAARRARVVYFDEDEMEVFDAHGGEPERLSRLQVVTEGVVLDGLWARRTLVVKANPRVTLTFDEAGFSAFRTWMEPVRVEAVGAIVRRQSTWHIVLGVLFLGSAWLETRPHAGLHTASIALGVSVLVLGVLSATWRSHYVLLGDALWSIGLASYVASWVLTGDSVIWIVLVGMLGANSWSYLKQYRLWSPLPLPVHATASDSNRAPGASPTDGSPDAEAPDRDEQTGDGHNLESPPPT